MSRFLPALTHRSIALPLRKYLVNLADRPLGCCSEECSHLHLRYDTRLDRELMDITWLTHGLIEERFANSTNGFQQGLKQESKKRVRKSLKLIAFYAQVSIAVICHVPESFNFSSPSRLNLSYSA
jgi:predicted transcriptional regulator